MARKRRSPPSGAQYLTTRLCAAFEDDQLHARADHQALPPTLPHAFAEERSYYSSMVQLVLDEAKAMVADGLASSRSSRAAHTRLTLENVARASAHGGGGGLGCMCFVQPRQSSEGDRFRAGSVFLLRSISFGVELLAVVDQPDLLRRDALLLHELLLDLLHGRALVEVELQLLPAPASQTAAACAAGSALHASAARSPAATPAL